MLYVEFMNVVDGLVNPEDSALLLSVFFGFDREDIKDLNVSDIKDNKTIYLPKSQTLYRLGDMQEDSLFEKRLQLAAKEDKWAYRNGHDDLVLNLPPANGKVFRTLDLIDKTIDERLTEIGIWNNLEEYFTFDKIRGYGKESYLTK